MPEDVKHVPGFELRGLVGFSPAIDQQRKRDLALLSKQAGIIQVTQPNSGQRCSQRPKLVFVVAQLRDMLAAEDSSIVP